MHIAHYIINAYCLHILHMCVMYYILLCYVWHAYNYTVRLPEFAYC